MNKERTRIFDPGRAWAATDFLTAALLGVICRVPHGDSRRQLAADRVPVYRLFYGQQPVTNIGYTGDAMGPFITKDGRFLLFNNRYKKPALADYFLLRSWIPK